MFHLNGVNRIICMRRYFTFKSVRVVGVYLAGVCCTCLPIVLNPFVCLPFYFSFESAIATIFNLNMYNMYEFDFIIAVSICSFIV